MKLAARYENRSYKNNGMIADGEHIHLIVDVPAPGKGMNRELAMATMKIRRELGELHNFGPTFDHAKVIGTFAAHGIELEVAA